MINVALDSQILSTLMSCARLTDLRFNRSLVKKGPKSNSLEAGSLVHVIAEHFGKSILLGKNRSDAIDIGFSYGALYRKFGDTYLAEQPEIESGLSIPDEDVGYDIGYNRVIETMQEYFDFWRADNFVIIAVEDTRKKVIYEDSDLRVLWKAKFDAILDGPHGFMSKDIKTMKQRRDTMSLNNQFMGQSVLLNSRQALIDKIGFQKSLKSADKFIRTIVNYSSDRLAEWVNDIIPYYARMYAAYHESGYWPPNFTHCENKYGKCDAVDYCESDRNMREEVARVEFIRTKTWDI